MTKDKNIYPNSIDTRVALLEQSIGHINQTLIRIENELKDFKMDIKGEIKGLKEEFKDQKKWAWAQFVFLFGAITGLAAVTAHGFRWL